MPLKDAAALEHGVWESQIGEKLGASPNRQVWANSACCAGRLHGVITDMWLWHELVKKGALAVLPGALLT